MDESGGGLQPYGEPVGLTSGGSRDTPANRRSQAGWGCLEGAGNRHKPGALRRLLTTLPARIETVMVIDPDVKICGGHGGSVVDLQGAIADLAQSGAAAGRPRTRSERGGFLGRVSDAGGTRGFLVGR